MASHLQGARPSTVELRTHRAPRAWAWQLAALFCVAWGWRLFYLYRLQHSPLSDSLTADAKTYWEWSGFLLRSGPLGKSPFFMGPLYPYVLALVRPLVHDSISGVLLLQSVGGAAAVVLLADAARRLTRPSVGLAVGLLVAGYEMAVFFDGLVLMESLLFFLESLLLWVVAREDWRNPRWMTLAAVGLLLGLLAQGRAISAVLVIPAALLLRERASAFGDASRRILLVLAFFVTVCAPSAIRNYALSGEWIPFTYNFGLNLFIGNNPGAAGGYMDVTTGAFAGLEEHRPIQDGGAEGDGRAYLQAVEGRHLSATESSRYWAGRALAYIRAHPGHAARLAVRRLGMLWNWREYPQIEDRAEFRALLGPIGAPLVGGFAFLGVLAIAGFAIAWRAGGASRFLVSYTAVMTLAIVPFFVTDRYRHHLVPGAVLLAAFSMDEMIRLASRLATARCLQFSGLLAIGIAVVTLPLPGLDSDRVAWNIASDLGDRWLDKGRPDLALPEYEKAVHIDRAGRLYGSDSPAGRVARAEVYANYGTSLLLLGRLDEAATSYEWALRLTPDAAPMVFALGEADAMRGRLDAARACCDRLGLAPSYMARDLVKKAFTASQIGQLGATEKLLLAAIALDSTETAPRRVLIRAYVMTGRLDDARAALIRARAAGFGGAALHIYQAMIAASGGDMHEATRALALVDESSLKTDKFLLEDLAYVRHLVASPRDTVH